MTELEREERKSYRTVGLKEKLPEIGFLKGSKVRTLQDQCMLILENVQYRKTVTQYLQFSQESIKIIRK